ncbi:MFS transporter [Parafrankia sp. FMc2]|uniref:MFS transporter n=1 Tax=Parafrankia sp. FMc2 TaxID=3233196 RepID=UPI0034D61900
MTQAIRGERGSPGLAAPRLALAVLCAGQMLIVLEQNIVNVALPDLQRGLGFSSANLVWVVNAYLVPFGGLLMLAGRLGDLIGRRTVFLTGVALFSAASLLCGFATSEAALIGFRFVQGVGGAVASACILGMVATMAPEPRAQVQAIAAYSFASAGGAAVGPPIGGALTDLASWNWIFFINAPVGAAVIVGALRTLPRDTGPGLGRGRGRGRGVDVPGAALVTAGLMLFVFTIVNAGQVGWRAGETLLLGPLSIALLAGFLAREATAAAPLLPLAMLRSRAVAAANLVQFLLIAGMFGLLFYGTLYVQRVLGYTSLQAGLAFVPIAVVIAAFSLGLSARLIMRFGPWVLLLGGLALITFAFGGLALARVDGTYLVDVLPATVLMGVGVGMAIPAVMALGMSAVEPGAAGVASGLFNTSQQIGGAIGLTVLSAVVSARTDSLADSGSSETSALLGGYHLGFLLAAGFTCGALLVTLTLLRTPRGPAANTRIPGADPTTPARVSSDQGAGGVFLGSS